jgi:hypothetical protein
MQSSLEVTLSSHAQKAAVNSLHVQGPRSQSQDKENTSGSIRRCPAKGRPVLNKVKQSMALKTRQNFRNKKQMLASVIEDPKPSMEDVDDNVPMTQVAITTINDSSDDSDNNDDDDDDDTTDDYESDDDDNDKNGDGTEDSSDNENETIDFDKEDSEKHGRNTSIQVVKYIDPHDKLLGKASEAPNKLAAAVKKHANTNKDINEEGWGNWDELEEDITKADDDVLGIQHNHVEAATPEEGINNPNTARQTHTTHAQATNQGATIRKLDEVIHDPCDSANEIKMNEGDPDTEEEQEQTTANISRGIDTLHDTLNDEQWTMVSLDRKRNMKSRKASSNQNIEEAQANGTEVLTPVQLLKFLSTLTSVNDKRAFPATQILRCNVTSHTEGPTAIVTPTTITILPRKNVTVVTRLVDGLLPCNADLYLASMHT